MLKQWFYRHFWSLLKLKVGTYSLLSEFMKRYEVIVWPLSKVTRICSFKHTLLRSRWAYQSQISYNTGWKNTHGCGHMTKLAMTPNGCGYITKMAMMPLLKIIFSGTRKSLGIQHLGLKALWRFYKWFWVDLDLH